VRGMRDVGGKEIRVDGKEREEYKDKEMYDV
jgi:hypothetical protein